MGLFNRRPATPEPVDRRKVMDLVRLGLVETDTGDRYLHDDKPGPDFWQAKAARDAAFAKATPAERRAAYEALRRHGY